MVEAIPQFSEICGALERKLTESAAKGADYMNYLADKALSSA